LSAYTLLGANEIDKSTNFRYLEFTVTSNKINIFLIDSLRPITYNITHMSLITHFDPWKNNLCTCPEKYSLSPYTGCGHGCFYCYASSYIRNFSQPRSKKDFLVRLNKEIKKIPQDSTIAIANSSDPYLPLEKTMHLTRSALELFTTYSFRINIVTKSNLILKDLPILKNLKKVVVCISLTTLDKNLSKKLEPFAPTPEERLKTIEKLSSHLPVAVRLDPLIYPLNTTSIQNIVNKLKQSGAKQIITSTYKIKPDNFRNMISAFPEHRTLWQRLYLKTNKNEWPHNYLPEDIRKRLIIEVKQSAENMGLLFSSCREGFNYLNTAACDGSSLFRE